MSVERDRTDMKLAETKTSTQTEPSPEQDVSTSAENIAPKMDIDPENEVTGIRLLLIHTGICLCTFLIGLVSSRLEGLGDRWHKS